MDDPEDVGVQRLPAEGGGDGAQAGVARRAPVGLVAEERVAGVLEVHADLVRAAGLEARLDEGGAGEALLHLPVRDRALAAGDARGELLAVARVAAVLRLEAAAF